jgi:hypothetical protein
VSVSKSASRSSVASTAWASARPRRDGDQAGGAGGGARCGIYNILCLAPTRAQRLQRVCLSFQNLEMISHKYNKVRRKRAEALLQPHMRVMPCRRRIVGHRWFAFPIARLLSSTTLTSHNALFAHTHSQLMILAQG